MAIIVPVVLGGLALAVMAIVSVFANRKRRRGPQAGAANHQRILIHAINDDRCTGCDACVAVCPTNVLDLVSNKSRVLRFQDCIQCEACMWACPTEALVMFPEGTEPPPVKAPAIDMNYQTAIPGQYLIGEVAGKPLVKNAANLGRAVVEHMLKNGLRPAQSSANSVDVLIVGSGPGGMSAALTCKQRGLSYLIIEKENIISSTVSRYPKGKLVMAEPYETRNLSFLPIFDSTKEEMVGLWQKLAESVQLQIKMHETVEVIHKQGDGSFATRTTGGEYRSQRVVLATGTRGKPRALGVPGEQFPKVESLLEDPDDHRGKAVCVVGGGDSALEAAMALSDSGAKVIISYRGRSFHRAQAKNRQQLDRMANEGRIKIKLQSEVVEFGEDTVTLQMLDGTQKRYPNQAAFVLIGADPPVQWLSTLGVHYIEKPHMSPMPASDMLVQQLVPDAMECPEEVEGAAALVFGQSVPARREPKRDRPPSKAKASVGRRFVRSASSLLGIGDERDKRPIPLSEFANRGHSEHGRRDQLEPGERTRILRMLRDEGGRQADEDSQVYKVADIMGNAEPEPFYSRGHRAEQLATLPPPVRGADAEPPKQALIVGLARASAGGPVRKPVRQRHVAAVHEEKTQHFTEQEARDLGLSTLSSSGPSSGPSPGPSSGPSSGPSFGPSFGPGSGPGAQTALRPPPPQAAQAPTRPAPSMPRPVVEEATNYMDFDPAQLMREAEAAAAAAAAAVPRYAAAEDTLQDEATRNVNVDALIDQHRNAPLPTPTRPSAALPTPSRDDKTNPTFEDKTRVVDHGFEPRSLSEVDWDLD